MVVRPFDFAQGDANDIYKKAEKSEKSGAEKKPSTEGKEAKANEKSKAEAESKRKSA